MLIALFFRSCRSYDKYIGSIKTGGQVNVHENYIKLKYNKIVNCWRIVKMAANGMIFITQYFYRCEPVLKAEVT